MRPPANTSRPKASPYITGAGFQALQDELSGLWRRRAAVTAALAAAAAEGDRSENAEYIYRKKELREIDRRIRYLQKRLPDLHVVNTHPTDRTKIFFGAWVEVEDDQERQQLLHIVGPDEIDPKSGHISVDSPLGRALLKHSVGDEITITVADQTTQYAVLAIHYDQPPHHSSTQ